MQVRKNRVCNNSAVTGNTTKITANDSKHRAPIYTCTERSVRQNLHIECCWFHFSQAVVRKAKKIGLSGVFRDDEHARKCIRCLTCLPLITT